MDLPFAGYVLPVVLATIAGIFAGLGELGLGPAVNFWRFQGDWGYFYLELIGAFIFGMSAYLNHSGRDAQVMSPVILAVAFALSNALFVGAYLFFTETQLPASRLWLFATMVLMMLLIFCSVMYQKSLEVTTLTS